MAWDGWSLARKSIEMTKRLGIPPFVGGIVLLTALLSGLACAEDQAPSTRLKDAQGGISVSWGEYRLPAPLAAPAPPTLNESIAFLLRWLGIILISLLALGCLIGWLRYYWRHNRVNYPRLRGWVTHLPGDLPAPVVSVLKTREVSDRTLLAIVLDMCGKGTLHLSYEGSRQFLLQPAAELEPEFQWERLVLRAVPGKAVEASVLRDRLRGRRDAIRRQMDDYLQGIGYFDGEPLAQKEAFSGWMWITLGVCAMMAGVSSGMWAVWVWPVWVSSLTGAAVGVAYFVAAFLAAEGGTKDLPPTTLGQREIGQWRLCDRSIEAMIRGAETKPEELARLLPYAVALNKATPWFYSWKKAGLLPPDWFQVNGATAQSLVADTNTTGGDGRLEHANDAQVLFRNVAHYRFSYFLMDDAWDLAGRVNLPLWRLGGGRGGGHIGGPGDGGGGPAGDGGGG